MELTKTKKRGVCVNELLRLYEMWHGSSMGIIIIIIILDMLNLWMVKWENQIVNIKLFKKFTILG